MYGRLDSGLMHICLQLRMLKEDSERFFFQPILSEQTMIVKNENITFQ